VRSTENKKKSTILAWKSWVVTLLLPVLPFLLLLLLFPSLWWFLPTGSSPFLFPSKQLFNLLSSSQLSHTQIQRGTCSWLGLISVGKEKEKRSMQLNMHLLQIDFGKRKGHLLSPPCINTPSLRVGVFGCWFKFVLVSHLVIPRPVSPPSELLR
jgi:hypothetical protein